MSAPRSGLDVLVKVNELGLGGTQLNALDFAAAAKRHDVNSIIVGYRETLPIDGPSLLDVAADRGIPVEVLNEGPRGGWRDRRRRSRELSALADRLDIDLVHTYGANSARQAYWGPCRFGRRPLVMTVYEMQVPARVYRTPPLIIGTRYLLEEQSAKRADVHLLSPPVDLEWDMPGRAPSAAIDELVPPAGERLRLVIVSRLAEDMKAFGIETAMRTMARLGRDDVELVVVGGGPAEARLRAVAAAVNDQLGRPAVRFAGPMVDPRAAFDSGDIVLAMGGAAARALALARPLIALGEHGWSETFRPETADWLYRNSFWSDETIVDGEELLAERIEELLASQRLRSELGDFGREFASTNFGLEVLTERLVSIYDDALSTVSGKRWMRDWGLEITNAGRRIRWKVGRGDAAE